jgi:hypothetical protein
MITTINYMHYKYYKIDRAQDIWHLLLITYGIIDTKFF